MISIYVQRYPYLSRILTTDLNTATKITFCPLDYHVMASDQVKKSENRWIELRLKVPHDTDWGDMKEIEDEISEAAGEILESYGLDRQSHRRIVEADYSDELTRKLD